MIFLVYAKGRGPQALRGQAGVRLYRIVSDTNFYCHAQGCTKSHAISRTLLLCCQANSLCNLGEQRPSRTGSRYRLRVREREPKTQVSRSNFSVREDNLNISRINPPSWLEDGNPFSASFSQWVYGYLPQLTLWATHNFTTL